MSLEPPSPRSSESVTSSGQALGWSLGLVLTLSVLVGNGLLSHYNARALASTDAWVTHTHQVISALGELQAHLTLAESSQRGYLITGVPEYAAPYQRALEDVEQQLERLRGLTTDNPAQQRRLAALAQSTALRVSELRRILALRDSSGSDAARVALLEHRGLRAMDAVRATVKEMIQTEEALLAPRTQRAHSSLKQATLTNLVATLTGVAVACLAYFLFWRDARARARASAVLHDHREWLRATLASIGDAVVATDRQARVTFMNKVAHDLTGWGEDAVGREVSEVFRIINETTREPVEAPTARVLREGTIVGLANHTLLLRRGGGEIPIDDSGAPIRGTDGSVSGVVLVFRDITEHKRVSDDLHRAKDAAEVANRAKSLFLANMSHELRTPLNAVIGYSEMLLEEAQELELSRFIPDLDRIHTAGMHLLSLINNILDLSKIEAGKMDLYLESFSVASMIRDVSDTILPLLKKNNNQLQVDCQADVGTIYADLTKLRQTLFNLLSNASKFTSGGRISLSAQRLREAQGEVLQLAVSDSGIGMSEEQMARLFESFSQADPSTTRRYGGTGLGLAISQRFCQLMGGDITVRSAPGQGATFTVRLPTQVKAPRAPSDLDDRDREELTLTAPAEVIDRRETILLVDDDPVALDLTRRYLEREGLHTETASSGETALRLARALRPTAILLDVMMPGMDGFAVLSALKADSALRDIPVIILSIIDNRNLGYALGVSEYLTKPVDRERLLQVLTRHSCRHPPCPVLLVEDDHATRATMRSLLKREGWEVTEAQDGQAALACLDQLTPELIILDLLMPGMDGFAFAARLREDPRWRAIPVVVLTAKDITPEDRQRLGGQVERIYNKSAQGREVLMTQVRDMLATCRPARLLR